jgi:hypothetical protein
MVDQMLSPGAATLIPTAILPGYIDHESPGGRKTGLTALGYPFWHCLGFLGEGLGLAVDPRTGALKATRPYATRLGGFGKR